MLNPSLFSSVKDCISCLDKISKEHRSWNMSRIKSKNTIPELLVRSTLHKMGYRFRLHGKVSIKAYSTGVLPGKPDIVLAKYRTVIFVHGCFWHHHKNCKRAMVPKTKTEWWMDKFNRNIQRDIMNRGILENLGWRVVIIWECEDMNKWLVDLQRLIDEGLRE